MIICVCNFVQRSSASPDRGKYDWSRSPGGASDSGIAKCRKLDDKVSF